MKKEEMAVRDASRLEILRLPTLRRDQVVPARSIYNQNTNSGDLGLDSLLFFSTHKEQLAPPFVPAGVWAQLGPESALPVFVLATKRDLHRTSSTEFRPVKNELNKHEAQL